MTTHRQTGKTAQKAGKWFEKAIEAQLEVYSRNKFALITKAPTPGKIVKGTHGKPKVIISGKATCDYFGCVSGKYVEFEAKAASSGRLEMALRPDVKTRGLQWHQLERLEYIEKFGGVSFVLFADTGQGGVYAILAKVLHWHWRSEFSTEEYAREVGKHTIPRKYVPTRAIEVGRIVFVDDKPHSIRDFDFLQDSVTEAF